MKIETRKETRKDPLWVRKLFTVATVMPMLLLAASRLTAQGTPCTIQSGSAITQVDPKTFQIGLVVLPSVFGENEACTLPFTLPLSGTLPGTMVTLQGTLSFRGNCDGDVVMRVGVSSQGKVYPMHLNLPFGPLAGVLGVSGGAQDLFVDFRVPLTFTSPSASFDVLISTNSSCSEADAGFQGILKIL